MLEFFFQSINNYYCKKNALHPLFSYNIDLTDFKWLNINDSRNVDVYINSVKEESYYNKPSIHTSDNNDLKKDLDNLMYFFFYLFNFIYPIFCLNWFYISILFIYFRKLLWKK